MVIADKGIIACGIVAPIEASLKAEGVDYVIYDQIVPNPRDIHCIAGAEFAREHGIDGMIAIGRRQLHGYRQGGGYPAGQRRQYPHLGYPRRAGATPSSP